MVGLQSALEIASMDSNRESEMFGFTSGPRHFIKINSSEKSERESSAV